MTVAMSDLVRLTCWSCGQPFGMKRSRGQYPNRCVHCTATETLAAHLRRRVRVLGLHSEIHQHDHQGYVCVVKTPWHDELVTVRDATDLEWLAAELGNRTHQAAAA